jgi:hypothetical protein
MKKTKPTPKKAVALRRKTTTNAVANATVELFDDAIATMMALRALYVIKKEELK